MVSDSLAALEGKLAKRTRSPLYGAGDLDPWRRWFWHRAPVLSDAHALLDVVLQPVRGSEFFPAVGTAEFLSGVALGPGRLFSAPVALGLLLLVFVHAGVVVVIFLLYRRHRLSFCLSFFVVGRVGVAALVFANAGFGIEGRGRIVAVLVLVVAVGMQFGIGYR